MQDRILSLVTTHAAKVVLVVVVLTLLLAGGVGEVAAHNPAGIEVAGCTNGAEVVAHKNPTCHG